VTSRNNSSASMFFKSAVAATGLLLSVYLVWKLRSLIVPVAFGGLMAYICRPLIAHLERYRMPRSLAIGLLLVGFVLAILGYYAYRYPGHRAQSPHALQTQ